MLTPINAFTILSLLYCADSIISVQHSKHSLFQSAGIADRYQWKISITQYLEEKCASIGGEYRWRKCIITDSISKLFDAFDAQRIPGPISGKDEIPVQMIVDLIGCMECDNATFSLKINQSRAATHRLVQAVSGAALFPFNTTEMTDDIGNANDSVTDSVIIDENWSQPVSSQQRDGEGCQGTGAIFDNVVIAVIYSLSCGFVGTMAIIITTKMVKSVTGLT